MLPLPSLRTHRAPFNAIGSSISKAHLDEMTRQYDCTDFTIIDGSNHALLLVGAPAKTEIRCHLLSHIKVIIHLSRDETPVESLLPFGIGQILNPYPHHYSTTFAFSNILYPLPHQLVLRLPYPDGKTSGLPCFACLPVWVRCYLIRRRCIICGAYSLSTHTCPPTFWFKCLSSFHLFRTHDA